MHQLRCIFRTPTSRSTTVLPYLCLSTETFIRHPHQGRRKLHVSPNYRQLRLNHDHFHCWRPYIGCDSRGSDPGASESPGWAKQAGIPGVCGLVITINIDSSMITCCLGWGPGRFTAFSDLHCEHTAQGPPTTGTVMYFNSEITILSDIILMKPARIRRLRVAT